METKISDNAFFTASNLESFHNIVGNKDIENLFQIKSSPSVSHEYNSQSAIDGSCNPQNAHKSNSVKYKNRGMKVQTIGGIRKQFDREQAEVLPKYLAEIEKCIENYLVGEKVNKVLKSKIETYLLEGAPLNRASFKGISKINLYSFLHKQQYIEVDGKKILLSGSLGGKVDCVKYSSAVKSFSKNSFLDKPILSNPVRSPGKRKNSLLTYTHPKFKPGPLSKKPRLNCADTVAKIELVAAPAICLDVFPKIGTKLDSTACFHLGNILKSNVSITAGWAEFASSLVTCDKSSELSSPSVNTFAIPYENNQNRMLMQKDLDWVERLGDHKETTGGNTPVDASVFDCVMQNLSKYNPRDEIEGSVKSLVTDLVHNVCVGQYQDRLWKYDTDYIPFEKSSIESSKKEKIPTKRKYNNELKRLDVTIIDYNDVNDTIKCSNEYCKLGCVCSSLQASCLLNNHCGQTKCMLRCICSFDRDFTHKSYAMEQNSKISNYAVANLQNHLNRYLSKEEKKFRRTVIRSNDQTVAIGACRRGSRVPKKYEDFILPESDILQETVNQKVARVELMRLSDCLQFDSLCMVHNLYRCFCKGIFTEGTPYDFSHRANEHSLLLDQSVSPSSVQSDNILLKKSDTSDTLTHASREIKIPLNTQTKIPSSQSPSSLLSSNDTECLKFDCSRTSYNEKYIKRSRKKILKLKEIYSRRKRHEESDPALSRQLNMLISKAFYARSVEGVDPDPLDLGIPPGVIDQHAVSSCSQENVKSLKIESEAIKISTSSAVPAISPSDTSSLTTSTTLDRSCLQFLLKNLELSNQSKIMHSETLPKHVLGEISIFSWKIFMRRFLDETIHIWATLEAPYKLYVTLNSLFTCPVEAVHILKNISNVDMFKGHPSIMQDLLSFDESINSLVVLVGTSFAWEAVAAMQQQSKRDSEPVSSEHASEKSADMADEKPGIHLPEIQSIQGNFIDAKPEDETPTSVSGFTPKLLVKSFPLSIFKFRWFQLSASNKFELLTINSKKIIMDREKIDTAIELSRSTGRIVAVLAQIQLQKNYKQPHFGVYIVPEYKNDILIGPYKMDEVSGIQTLKDPRNFVSEIYHGCWLKDAIKYNSLAAAAVKGSPDVRNNSEDSIETANLKGKVTYLCLSTMNEFSSVRSSKKTNSPVEKNMIANFEHNGMKYRIVKCLKQNGINKINSFLGRNAGGTAQKSLLKPLDSTEISRDIRLEICSKPATVKPCVILKDDKAKDLVSESVKSKVAVLDNTKNGKVVHQPKNASVTKKDEIKEDSEESENDDVIFMPVVNEVVEISDSDEDGEINQKNVWFACANIPQLGYISATMEANSLITLKFKNIGPVQCTSPVAGTIRINNLLKKYVGFIPSSLNSNWELITNSKDIRHLQAFDEERFNKSHVITEVGFKKRTKKTISTHGITLKRK